MKKNTDVNQLFNNLMKLSKESESFFFKDFSLDDKVYRIFNYRLASWTEFQLPDAINARGIMFDITSDCNPTIACMPPTKFFNYEEGGVNHKQNKIGDQMVKMDGSLISTYLHNGDLLLKSKSSLFSTQALSAMNLLNNPENSALKIELQILANMSYTANMEYTSPSNRVVVSYEKDALTLLGIREHNTGMSLYASELEVFLDRHNMPELKKILVKYISLKDRVINQEEYVSSIKAEQEGEGYVVEMVGEDGAYLVKLKNTKYLMLHQTKEAIFSDKKLFEAVIEEVTDDLRTLFIDDDHIIRRIEDMENRVRPVYNHMMSTVESFVEKNKHLTRKEFAILGQAETNQLFGLCMASYLGKEVSFKEFAKKYRREIFNIEDKIFDLEEIRSSEVFKKRSPT